MYLGQIVERGTMETVYRNRAHPYTKALFSATPAFTAAEKQKKQRILLEGDVPSPVDPPKGCRFRGRCPYADKRCEEEPRWQRGGGQPLRQVPPLFLIFGGRRPWKYTSPLYYHGRINAR